MSISVKFKGRSEIFKFKIPKSVPGDFALKVNEDCRKFYGMTDGSIRMADNGHIPLDFEKGVAYEFRRAQGSEIAGCIDVADKSLKCDLSTVLFQKEYIMFGQVCGSGTYAPCRRIQELLGSHVDQQEVVRYVCKFERWELNNRGVYQSEELEFLHSMFSMMANFSGESVSLFSEKAVTKSAFVPQKAASFEIAQYGLSYHLKKLRSPTIVEVITGCGAISDSFVSVRQCFPDILAVCGRKCIELHRAGLSRENSVMPCFAMAGSTIQFLAVYLMRDCFPVLVELSPELNVFGTFEEQDQVATWCLRFVSFGKDTADMLQKMHVSGTVSSSLTVSLNTSGYFFKPVRDLRLYEQQSLKWQLLRLDQIMRIYERIRLACQQVVPKINPYRVILFPEGVLSVPPFDSHASEGESLRSLLISQCRQDGFYISKQSHTPLILFPRLSTSEGWRTDKPRTPDQRYAYVTQLRVAVNALNTARIAHLDLHPGNIMWRHAPTRSDAQRVELQVIDFDYAVLFGRVIPEELVQSVVHKRDRRYPFKDGDEETVQIAREFHNNYFLECVSGWVHSEVEEFVHFMESHWCDILCGLQCEC